MSERLHVAPRPCTTCPYRTDTPAGIWDASEYRKLPAYDRNGGGVGPFEVFHCHQEHVTEKPTVCRGWLAVHQFDSTAIRLAVMRGALTVADVEAGVDVELYESGTEACAAGLAGVDSPDRDAQVAMAKLLARGVPDHGGAS